ncbi:U-box domain containing protein [Fonsecaea pedrosoi]|nr:U-box domain containing protein [Fonsecaea pedrosoi]
MSSSQADSTMSEDFAIVDHPRALPLRPRSVHSGDHAVAEIHPLQDMEAFIVSVQPPQVPEQGLKRACCDIVLVIDVSGSMSAAAPLPEVEDEHDREAAGLSVLDLVKHAARTILETLGQGDRLGIVTFSDDATVVQPLTFMKPAEKKATWTRIEKLRDDACTNLWAGIRTGLNLFSEAPLVDNIQGLYVLTDGQPNHLCPKQGYVAKLGPMLEAAAHDRPVIPTIHTFGFGYQIRSGLMQSIAEVGRGNYAFIPDAGMIGTVFVHSVANLYTTLGMSASLEVELSKDISIGTTSGTFAAGERGHILNLGNIQYGQSRDVVFVCPEGIPEDTAITVTLKYTVANGATRESQSCAMFSDKTVKPHTWVEYHLRRAQLCGFISSLFPLKSDGLRKDNMDKGSLVEAQKRLGDIISVMRQSPNKDVPELKALLEELVGDEPAGQISKALTWTSGKNYWNKWGRLYLPSLLHAHQRQMCNSFKDPGPLLYGKDSPLFIKFRTELDTAFDNLPTPKPSRPPRVVFTYSPTGEVTGTRTIAHRNVSMNSYNSSSAPCFEGNCSVLMGDGTTKQPIKDIKTGMLVWTPKGPRMVGAVLKTRVHGQAQTLCRVGELLVTPWHPIKYQGQWRFPNDVAESSLTFKGSVYSMFLGPCFDPDGHAIQIGGQICVTLGHGLVKSSQDDIRGHPFFGDYEQVALSLLRLPEDNKGRLTCGGMLKNVETGLACRFLRPSRSWCNRHQEWTRVDEHEMPCLSRESRL